MDLPVSFVIYLITDLSFPGKAGESPFQMKRLFRYAAEAPHKNAPYYQNRGFPNSVLSSPFCFHTSYGLLFGRPHQHYPRLHKARIQPPH